MNAATSEIVMDKTTGRIIHEKNINTSSLIASTTKIMTAIVAIENGNLNEYCKVGEEIKEVYGSSLYLKEKEKIKLNDLLYGLLLRSGNDASVVIEKNIFNNRENFIREMNKLAISIGMKNTNFNNSHGLDNVTKNTSTVKDMAILMKYAMNNKIFKKIIKTKKYEFKTNLNEYVIYNKNKLLSSYKYCVGGKTGYTELAHNTFASNSVKDNKNFIIVTFNDENRFKTHKNLYETYFKKYDYYKILDKYTFSLTDKNYKNKNIYIKKNLMCLLSEKEKKKIRLDVIIKKNKKIKNNMIIGEARIVLNNKIISKVNLYINKYNNINIKKWYKIF